MTLRRFASACALALFASACTDLLTAPPRAIDAPVGASIGHSTSFSATGGLQTFVVPAGVTQIKVTAIGAAGGASGGRAGGRGAQTAGTFNLPSGATLRIYVGAQGGASGTGGGGGGGGGTFVQRILSPNSFAGIMYAGGGGGASCSAAGLDALTTGSGGNSQGGTVPFAFPQLPAALFSAGGGGGNSFDQGTPGESVPTAPGGGGGGGWIQGFGGGGGPAGQGGFGGGAGGGTGGGGGGGGWVGGNGGNVLAAGPTCNSNGGGGGTSFNPGQNPQNTAGVGTGNGSVLIEWEEFFSDLIVTASAPASAFAPFDMSATVTNLAGDPTPSATLTAELGAGLSVSGLPSGCSIAATTVTCTLGAIAVGGSVTRTLSVTSATPGGHAVNWSTSSGIADPNPANDVAITNTVVGDAPQFIFPGVLPNPDACVCMPLFMVQNPASTQFWWARASGTGDLVISPYAVGVNPGENGILTVRVFDPANALVGSASATQPASGEASLPPITITGPASGQRYRIEVGVAGTAPVARHYRLKLRGATLVGTGTPLQQQAEHEPARWLLNVQAGEPINVVVQPGAEAPAANATVRLYRPDGTLAQTGGLGTTLGAAPASLPGQWLLDVDADGRYVVTKSGGADNGLYAGWQVAGAGALDVTLTNGGDPNETPYNVIVTDVLTNDVIAEHLVTDHFLFHLPARRYRVTIRGGRGDIGLDAVVTCDATTFLTADIPNAPPVAQPDHAITQPVTAVVIPVLANDSDPDNDPIALVSVAQPSNGSVTINGSSVTYTPAAGYTGTDEFSYVIEDGVGGQATGHVTVLVNTPPVALPDTGSAPAASVPVTVNVLANDSDADHDPLTVVAVTQGAHGTVTTNGTTVTYASSAGFAGIDAFSYTISDGQGGTATATVTIKVNGPPVANPDAASTQAGVPVTVAVLANDTDPDDDPITVTGVTQGTSGSATTNGTTVTYIPNAGFAGTDSFGYTIGDGHAGTATATVTVVVNGPPVANPDVASTNTATAVTIPVLANDTDPNGDALTVDSVLPGAGGGTTTNGTTVTYTPNAGFGGADSFEYTITDGKGGSATTTVTVNVNRAPVAQNDAATTQAGSAVTVAVLGNDSDPDGNALTVTAVTQGANGSVATNGTTVAYTPNGGFDGMDTFTYTIGDGHGGSATATVNVTVSRPVVTVANGLVRHAPTLNARVEGSLAVMTAESVTLNGNAAITGSLFVPGTPTVRLNGQPTLGSVVDGSGSAAPTSHVVTLNGNAGLGTLVRRTNPTALPTVSAPASPTGTRTVILNRASDPIGVWATVKNLTLNGSVGTVTMPPGAYGDVTVNGGSTLVLGVAGSSTPTKYDFQSLLLNGQADVRVVGPVIVTVGTTVVLNGNVGAAGRPEWLTLRVRGGGLTLNGNVSLSGFALVPDGTLTVNGGSTLTGGLAADRLLLNGGAVVRITGGIPAP